MVYDFSVLFQDELVADVHILTRRKTNHLSGDIFLDRNSHSCVTDRIFYIFLDFWNPDALKMQDLI